MYNFDAKNHVHTLDGRPLIGITSALQVIAKPALIPWASKMAVEAVESMGELLGDVLTVKDWPTVKIEASKAHAKKKDKGASRGTDTHAEIEEVVKLAIKEYDGYIKPEHFMAYPDNVKSFVQWAIENKIKFIESEKGMYSREWWTGGITDLLFEKDGKRFIGDLKTQKAIYDRTPFFQMAAYRKMAIEMNEQTIDGTCIIHLPETNKLSTYYSFDWESDEQAFVAALTLYKALQNEVPEKQ